jgi:hypothetical protein
MESHELPFPLASISAGSGAVFGIEELGEGRLARFSPDAGVTAASAGQALRLIAASEDFAWTVDDAAGRVIAFGSHSLRSVRSFSHLGSPDALVARGSRAWYVSTAEVSLPEVNGRQQRAVRAGPSGFTAVVLRLDAATGTCEQLCELAAVAPEVVLDTESLWISGPRREDMTDDEPVSALRCLDLDGQLVSAIELAGQIDAIAVDDAAVWVSGFRRSRQVQVVTALNRDGTVIGEVSLAQLDLGPWALPAPPRPPALSLAERARAVRDAAERSLAEPSQVHDRFGDRWEEPAVSERFHLERVEVIDASGDPQIAVLFRWSGEDDLFGLSYAIPGRDESLDAPDAYISVYVEEDLLAAGRGVANAIREPASGVTWLRWRSR